jgi:Flp pilus assembly secretin CpaC
MRPLFSRVFTLAVPLVVALVGGLGVASLPQAALAMLVPINHAERVDLHGDAASVVVGNQTIASVTVIDSHTLYIMGRGPGSTNVIVLDKAGRTLFTGEVTVAAQGSNVSLYRGDKRIQVNCTYGCIESTDDRQPNVALHGSPGAPGMIGAAPGATQP